MVYIRSTKSLGLFKNTLRCASVEKGQKASITSIISLLGYYDTVGFGAL